MKLLWISDPKLHEINDVKAFLEKRTEKDREIKGVILTGFVANHANFNPAVNEIASVFPSTTFVMPSLDCVAGSDFRSFAKKTAPFSWDLREHGPLFLALKATKCALFGRPGCEDGAYGKPNIENLPSRTKISDLKKPTWEERFKVMGTRSHNEGRRLNAMAQKAQRDREVTQTLILLGTIPYPELFTVNKNREDFLPFFVSKGMGDTLDYRDGLRTAFKTTVLCSGGASYAEKTLASGKTRVIQGGGHHKPGGHSYLITIEDNSLEVSPLPLLNGWNLFLLKT